MRLRVQLEFPSRYAGLIREAARQCQMSETEFCNRAVLLITFQGMEEVIDGSEHKPEAGVPAGDSTDVSPSGDASPDSLPDSEVSSS